MQLPQTLIHWLLVGSAAAAIIFFNAGLANYFEHPNHRRWWVHLIHDAGMLLSLAHMAGVLLMPPRSEIFATAGIVLYCVAMTVFLAAIESARRTRLQRTFVDHPLPDRLITDGPYRWVRHPFYLGYMLGAVAAPVAIDSLVLLLLAVAMVGLTTLAAFREERIWLASPRAASYREYRARTGMLLPFIGRG